MYVVNALTSVFAASTVKVVKVPGVRLSSSIVIPVLYFAIL